METIMNKSIKNELTVEQRNSLITVMKQLLDQYEYGWNSRALEAIIDEWNAAKGWMIQLFEKHPYYNNNFQIEIPANLHRPIDKEGIDTFKEWFKREYNKSLEKERVMVGLFRYEEYEAAVSATRSNAMQCPYQGTLKGYDIHYWSAEYDRMEKRLEEAQKAYRPRTITYDVGCMDYRTITITYEKAKERGEIFDVIDYALNVGNADEGGLISESMAESINRCLDRTNLNARAIVGQRIPRFVGKLCKELGLNKVVDVHTFNWTDNNGNICERTKDMGYNYHFALLGDSMSPDTYNGRVVISVNPIDFWTMSLGYKWASCHTIDIHNRRGVGSNHHQGCYSGGTSSYMMDDSTFVVYIRPTDEQINSVGESELPMEMQSKMKRCLFFLGEDKLIQSRVYPDGRDGGDSGLAGQLRAIVQKAIADLYDTSNMWTIKRGTSETKAMIEDGYHQIHYPDYRHYNDVNVSFLRRINGDLNHNKIKVGVEEIVCPCCGLYHSEESHITCNNCHDESDYEYTCEACGDGIREYDSYIRTADGHYYCCTECAEREGYVWCEDDDDEMHYREDCVQDNYSGCWYTDNYDGISTYEGRWYANETNLYEDGNEWCRDIQEYSDDWVMTVNENIYHNRSELIQVDGGWYESDEDLVEAGYTMDDEGNWVLADTDNDDAISA